MGSAATSVRPCTGADRAAVAEALEGWGMRRLVSRGRLTDDASTLPGWVAERDGRLVGLALVRQEGDEVELVAILALDLHVGVGTPLLDAVVADARRRAVARLWLVTTNDNLDALRFYQRRGWRLAALHVDAMETSRRLKPEIPRVGAYGIELRHELELEAPLD